MKEGHFLGLGLVLAFAEALIIIFNEIAKKQIDPSQQPLSPQHLKRQPNPNKSPNGRYLLQKILHKNTPQLHPIILTKILETHPSLYRRTPSSSLQISGKCGTGKRGVREVGRRGWVVLQELCENTEDEE